MNRRKLIIGILGIAAPLLLPGLAPHASAEGREIVVVVNKSNGIAPMNRAQLNAIFKAKASQFPGGGRADAVNLSPDNPVRQDFDYAVLGMTPDEVERFWLDSKIRSGVGSPRKLSGPDAVVHFVDSEEAGIGYVARADANGSVRIIARIRGGEVLPP